MKLEWVRGYADKTPWETIDYLILQCLSRDKIFNVWCDRAAKQVWGKGLPGFPDPATNPIERWAVFSRIPYLHKIT